VQLELKVWLVTLELLDSLVVLAHRVTEDPRAHRDHKAPGDQLDLMDYLDHRVTVDPLERLDRLDLRAVRVKEDRQAHWEIQELLVQLVPVAHWVRLEIEDPWVLQEALETVGLLDSEVTKVSLVTLDHLAHLEIPEE